MDLQSLLLNLVSTYGAWALGGIVLVAALGVPLPSSFALLAGGALIQQGVLDLPGSLALAFGGAVLGDTLSYGLGRWLGGPLRARWGQTAAWQQATRYFAQRGAAAIYLTRWAVTVLALPTNWIAGGSGYPAGRFVRTAALGELTWVLVYGGVGYLVGSQWANVSTILSQGSGAVLALVLLGGGLYAAWRYFHPQQQALVKIKSVG